MTTKMCSKIEIPKRLNQITALFYRIGMWKNEEETVCREVARKLLYLLVYLCFTVSIASGAFVSDDDDESLFLAGVAIIAVVATVKMSYILWKKNEILTFIHDIGVHSIKDCEVSIKVNKKLKIFMQLASCFLVMVFAAVLFLSISTLPVMSSEKRLPLNIWFPLDWKNTKIGYWMSFTFVVFGMILSSVCMLVAVLIWYVMMNCSIKYEVLGNQFSKMGVIVDTKLNNCNISEAQKQKVFLQELTGLIKTHRDVKWKIDRFVSCLSYLFLVQVVTSAVSICSSIYALAFSSSLIQAGVYVVALTYNFFDIFVVMYFGNEIKLSSTRLSYCLFESNWLEQSKECKICILILTEVLKKPHELVICKLYKLDLETFTSILNLAYRLFNILLNIK